MSIVGWLIVVAAAGCATFAFGLVVGSKVAYAAGYRAGDTDARIAADDIYQRYLR